jgi:hypothetical protein
VGEADDAAATLTAGDLPRGHQYPVSLYRALGLLWVTSARRPNELLRLRLDCLRRDWDPVMRDDDGQPLPAAGRVGERGAGAGAPLCYLHVPAGKNRGPFWIWIPDYTADAIDAWKAARPSGQRRQLYAKDREAVDYLFAVRERRVGDQILNDTLMYVLWNAPPEPRRCSQSPHSHFAEQ